MERAVTTGARNGHGGAFEQRQRSFAMCAARFFPAASLVGEIGYSYFSARLAASEAAPKAGSAGFSPT